MNNKEKITGIINKIIFHNAETLYTIAEVYTEDAIEIVTGNILNPKENDKFDFNGEYINHEKYGLQFKIDSYFVNHEKSNEELISFLSSSIFNGIGIKKAEKIVNYLGNSAIEIILEKPDILRDIDGITDKNINSIITGLNEYENNKTIMLLHKYGISVEQSIQYINTYGDDINEQLQNNPYSLIGKINNYGFAKADDIAIKNNIDADNPIRVKACIVHLLNDYCYRFGHTYMHFDSLLEKVCIKLKLNLTDEVIEKYLFDISIERSVYIEQLEDKMIIYPYNLYYYESNSAKAIKYLLKQTFEPTKKEISKINNIEKNEKITLSEYQREAIFSALHNKISIITGGPGTGKTTLINILIKYFELENLSTSLMAPTGRAAKRMTESTGVHAKTIHRALEYTHTDQGWRFLRNSDNPLEESVYIIDEMSMVDVSLFYHLISSLPDMSRIILVGDSDQLPSVGAGNVLHDLIKSDVIPTYQLTDIFRQANDSDIIINAHRINKGNNIINNKKDFFFIERNSWESVYAEIESLLMYRLKNAYKYDVMKDVQILCPQKKSNVGNTMLNEYIQSLFHKNDDFIVHFDRKFFVNDKVMQVTNNYNIETYNQVTNEVSSGVFNGDIGSIIDIDSDLKKVKILFDEKLVTYSFDELKQIEHAYSITVHKSQGSEFPVIIIPLYKLNFLLANRSVLYTAITRAKNLCIIIGEKRSLNNMIKNIDERKRNTSLYKLLKEVTI